MSSIIAQLRAALEHYADDENYDYGSPGPFHARAVLDATKDAAMTEPTREALTAELAALDARKAKVQAQIDKMPPVYRSYWGASSNSFTLRKFDADTHYLEWTLENGVPRVIGDFKRIDE